MLARQCACTLEELLMERKLSSWEIVLWCALWEVEAKEQKQAMERAKHSR